MKTFMMSFTVEIGAGYVGSIFARSNLTNHSVLISYFDNCLVLCVCVCVFSSIF